MRTEHQAGGPPVAGVTVLRRIDRNGLTASGRTYHSEVLSTFAATGCRHVEVRVDPRDPDVAFVRTGPGREWHAVEATAGRFAGPCRALLVDVTLRDGAPHAGAVLVGGIAGPVIAAAGPTFPDALAAALALVPGVARLTMTEADASLPDLATLLDDMDVAVTFGRHPGVALGLAVDLRTALSRCSSPEEATTVARAWETARLPPCPDRLRPTVPVTTTGPADVKVIPFAEFRGRRRRVSAGVRERVGHRERPSKRKRAPEPSHERPDLFDHADIPVERNSQGRPVGPAGRETPRHVQTGHRRDP